MSDLYEGKELSGGNLCVERVTRSEMVEMKI